MQMKSIKYLSLKSKEDVFMTAHSSCLLDRHFFEKYTNKGIKEKELREKEMELVKQQRRLEKENNTDSKKEQQNIVSTNRQNEDQPIILEDVKLQEINEGGSSDDEEYKSYTQYSDEDEFVGEINEKEKALKLKGNTKFTPRQSKLTKEEQDK